MRKNGSNAISFSGASTFKTFELLEQSCFSKGAVQNKRLTIYFMIPSCFHNYDS